jgi:hypothetical protein
VGHYCGTHQNLNILELSKFIEENMIWGFDDNFHSEAKLA